MAKISTRKDPAIVKLYEGRRVYAALRRSGHIILTRHPSPGHYDSGTIKAGLSAEDFVEEALRVGGINGLNLRVEWAIWGDDRHKPVVTHTKAAQRKRAAERREIKAAAEARERVAKLADKARELGLKVDILKQYDYMRVSMLKESLKFICGTALGFCAKCRNSTSWNTGGVTRNEWICSKCWESAWNRMPDEYTTKHEMWEVADQVDGLYMYGPLVDLALKLDPDDLTIH